MRRRNVRVRLAPFGSWFIRRGTTGPAAPEKYSKRSTQNGFLTLCGFISLCNQARGDASLEVENRYAFPFVNVTRHRWLNFHLALEVIWVLKSLETGSRFWRPALLGQSFPGTRKAGALSGPIWADPR